VGIFTRANSERNFDISKAHCKSCGWFLFAGEPDEFKDKGPLLREIECPSCGKLDVLDSLEMIVTVTAQTQSGALALFKDKKSVDVVYHLHEQIVGIRKALDEIEAVIKRVEPHEIINYDEIVGFDAFDSEGGL
jgi:hypothetical protein